MKKFKIKSLLLIATIAFFALESSAQEIKSKTSGNDCDGYWNDAKKDCSASSGICCLKTVVVKPKFNLAVFDKLIATENIAKIKEYFAGKMFDAALPENLITKEWTRIIEGIKSGEITIVKVNGIEKGYHYLLEKVTKENKASAKKHDYVGHVTLLR